MGKRCFRGWIAAVWRVLLDETEHSPCCIWLVARLRVHYRDFPAIVTAINRPQPYPAPAGEGAALRCLAPYCVAYICLDRNWYLTGEVMEL